MEPYYADSWLTVYQGDNREVLRTMEPESVHCVVTSPPYYALRDYGVGGQIGLEGSVDEYVAALVDVFREVRRVLRKDGTLWLNIGDSYAGVGAQTGGTSSKETGRRADRMFAGGYRTLPEGVKQKDLYGVPWRVAFALQADGWYLRSDIIWSKPNPMPESVTDRPTKAHEYLFLLSKSPRYYYDADAVREPHITASNVRDPGTEAYGTEGRRTPLSPGARDFNHPNGRNLRSVWTIATQPYPGAHFATFPRKLVEPCIKAGCPADGTVLDPFAGSGTTGMVAQALGRRAILIDLNADYLAQALTRNRDIPLGLSA